MKKFIAALAVTSAIVLASSAQAAIVVDGQLDAAYGAATAVVGYDPAAATSNFGPPAALPGVDSSATGYSIYLTSDTSNVYGFLKATGPVSIDDFSNLYFDVDPGNGASPDIVFQITNSMGAILGQALQPVALSYAVSSDGSGIEFSIPDAYFMGPSIHDGDQVYLRLSQSFGYSVAGGPTFGPNGLGAVTIGGVPEPTTWAMMLMGFFGLGSVLRSGRRQTAVA